MLTIINGVDEMQLLSYIVKQFKKIQPVKYAKERGVIIGEGPRFADLPDFGSEPYLVSLGNRVTISCDVVFITHDGATWLFRDQPKYKNVIKFGKIVVKDNCFIGARVTILPGVTIGPNSIVAVGSVVTKDVMPNSVYGGVPAKYICTLDEYAEKCLENTPKYDLENYKMNKREELLKILK